MQASPATAEAKLVGRTWTATRRSMRRVPGIDSLIDTVRYMSLPEPIRTAKHLSMLSYIELFHLQELARRLDCADVAGDFVECGVYKGGSAAVLGYEVQRSRTDRHLWLYDAFAGMPPAGAQDDGPSHEIVGKFVGSELKVRRAMRRLEVDPNRFTVVTGWYEATMPVARPQSIALLHVDCDFYDPVRLVLETLYPRVVPGGYVVLNDYGAFQGCRTATDEFLANRTDAGPLIQVDVDAYFLQKH